MKNTPNPITATPPMIPAQRVGLSEKMFKPPSVGLASVPEPNGDIFISIERIKENAENFNASFQEELSRVMVHGVLHYCGYNDKTEADIKIMRNKENFYINQLS